MMRTLGDGSLRLPADGRDNRSPRVRPDSISGQVENEDDQDDDHQHSDDDADNSTVHDNPLPIENNWIVVNPLIPDSPVMEPIRPDPRDEYSPFTPIWIGWIGAFIVIEAIAVWQDRKHPDRVKRTLSSNARTWFATDSVTGIPLDAKFGKPRRIALLFLTTWLGEHLKQQKRV